MANPVTQPESFLERPPPASLVWGVAGVLAGVVLYALAFTATMSWVPRIEENSHSIVDIPWRVYATLPTTVAAAIALAAGFAKSGSRRIGFWIGAAISNGLCTMVGLVMLKQDYIGEL